MSQITSTKTIVINGIAVTIDEYMRDGTVTVDIGGINVKVGYHSKRGESCASVEVFDLDGEKVHNSVIE